MISPALSLFLLRELPFSRFDFPRWQSILAVTLIGVLAGLDPGLRAGTPEMPGMPLWLAIPFMVLSVWAAFLVIVGVLAWWLKRGGRWDGQGGDDRDTAGLARQGAGIVLVGRVERPHVAKPSQNRHLTTGGGDRFTKNQKPLTGSSMYFRPPIFLGLAALYAGCACAPAFADLPLTIEDLITDKGKVKLDLSFAYANVDRQGVSTGEPIVVQTGPASFVTLPTAIGTSIGNSDTLVGAVGLRYGLSAKTELYARASALTSRQRGSGVSGTSSSNESRFADAWAGVNVQFKKDDATPALLGFAELALAEKHRHDTARFKSAMLGATTYKAIDPIVFSATVGYRFNHSRKDGGQELKPGNLLLINPSVGFAVNDRVTLSTGLQWTRRQADRLDGTAQGIDRTATDLVLGVGYGFDKGNTLNATFKANASGSDGAEVRVNWLYTFR